MKKLAEDFQLQIASPCHEDWERMLPDEKGKFCLSCQKAVYDFTHKTREEIIEFFRQRKFQTVCGRVNNDVLKHPAIVQQETFRRRGTYRLAWFAYALFLVFGSTLFSCNNAVPENKQPQLIGMMMTEPTAINIDTPVSKKEISAESNVIRKAGLPKTVVSTFQDTVLLPDIIVEGVMEQIDWNRRESFTMLGAISICHISMDGQITDPPFPHSPIGKEEEKPAISLQDPFLEIYPNPSAGQFHVRFNLIKPVAVELDVFNISGQFIQRIISSQERNEGEYVEDVNLNPLAAGIYFLRLQMGDEVLTNRLVIAK